MEDPEKLKVIFSELKRRGLFFLDSRTTLKPLASRQRSLLASRHGENAFIDNSSDEEEIKKELGR